MKYSEQLLQYFYHREHAGRLDVNDPQVIFAQAGRPQNGDVLALYLRCDNQKIQTARFQAAGSVYIISAGEFVCTWLENKTLHQFSELTPKIILQNLGLTSLQIPIANLVSMVLQDCLVFNRS